MKEKTFNEFKTWILQEAVKVEACSEGKNDANNANDWQSLLDVIKKYSSWLYSAKIINAENLLQVPDEELLNAGIYVKKVNISVNNKCYLYNSSVEAWGNSSVVAWENSSVVAWGNSSVVAWGNSSVVAWENSSVEAWGNSSVEARENSSVVAWGNSSVEAWGNSSVVAWGNSSVVAWGNSYIQPYYLSQTKVNDKAIVRERSTGKVYFKKNAFEIVEL